MARPRYLADTSAFARLSKPGVAAAFAPLVAQGQVALCAPVTFELAYSARNPVDYLELTSRLNSFAQVPVTEADHRRALDIQASLASISAHRALSLVDGLVAAIAEARDLIVLHYDADFELIASVIDGAQQWV